MMTDFKCPCCGHQTPTTIQITDLREVCRGRISGRVLALLIEAKGRGITAKALVNLVYADDPDGGPLNATPSMKVIICRLRRNLKPFGWTIPKTHAQLGVYRLAPLVVE
jgi:DNA-binding response OmpR family regulator